MRVAIIGGGRVGLPLSAALAECGHAVICCERDSHRQKAAAKGCAPFLDTGLDAMLAKTIASGALQFCGDLATAIKDSEVVIAAVPATSGGGEEEDGLNDIAAAIALHASTHSVLAVKSTVKPGVCKMLEKKHGICVAYNPEFLEEGRGLYGCVHPERIVVGADSAPARLALRAVYAPFIQQGVVYIETDRQSAEIAKLASNLFLAARVTLINETADLCEVEGGNISEVTRILAADNRIGGLYLRAGAGFGGTCLPKDGRLLLEATHQAGASSAAISAVYQSNRQRSELIAKRISEQTVKNSIICIWGAAFKPGADNACNSPAIGIMRHLLDYGYSIQVCEPRADLAALKKRLPEAVFYDDCMAALAGAETLAVLNYNAVFEKYAPADIMQAMRGNVIFDYAGVMNDDSCQSAGARLYMAGISPLATSAANK